MKFTRTFEVISEPNALPGMIALTRSKLRVTELLDDGGFELDALDRDGVDRVKLRLSRESLRELGEMCIQMANQTEGR